MNPIKSLASGVGVGPHMPGINLGSQSDDFHRLNQRFFLGNHESIFISKCPGLVISMKSLASRDHSNTIGHTLMLQQFVHNEIHLKWKLIDNGSSESAKCPGMVISGGTEDLVAMILEYCNVYNSTQT